MWRSSAGRGAAPLDCRFIVESRRRQGRAARSLPLTSTGCNDTFPSIVTILKFSKQQCNQLHCWRSRWNPCFIACYVAVLKQAITLKHSTACFRVAVHQSARATGEAGAHGTRQRPEARSEAEARATQPPDTQRQRRRLQTFTREPGRKAPQALEQAPRERPAGPRGQGREAAARARQHQMTLRARWARSWGATPTRPEQQPSARGGRAPGADALHFADPQTKSIARALKGAAAQPGGRRRAAPPGTEQPLPGWIIDQAARRSAPGADRARLQPVRDGAQGRLRRASLTCPLTCPLTFPLPLWRLQCLFVRDSPSFCLSAL